MPHKDTLQRQAMLLPAVLVWLSAGTALFGQSRYVGWHTSLKTAAEKAESTGKPIMVVFRCVR